MPLTDLIDDALETEEIERAREFKERWNLYEGKHPDSLPVVRGNEGRPDVNDNVKYNAAGITVDRGVSALFGGIDQEIQFALQESGFEGDDQQEGDAEDSPDQEWLERVWDANSKKTLLSDLGTNGGVCGHVFLRLYETGARRDPTLPRVVNLDPAYCVPVFEEDDYEQIVGWKIQFPVGDQRVRRTLVEPNNLDMEAIGADSWLITDQVAVAGEQWESLGEPEIWDFPFPPILDWKNLPRPNQYWGKADIEHDVRDLNYAMNRSLSSMQRILRLFGHPRPFATGTTPDQLAILIQGVDRIITLPDGATLDQLEMTGDLSSSIEYLREVKSAFSEVAKNPQVDPAKLGSIGGMSGVALRILYQPMLEQTGTKRGTYGDGLSELNRRLLLLGGITPSPVTINWPDPIPANFRETTEALVAQTSIGLSHETALETLGYDPALEQERRANDTVSVGTGLSDIVDALGQANGNGVPVSETA